MERQSHFHVSLFTQKAITNNNLDLQCTSVQNNNVQRKIVIFGAAAIALQETTRFV